MSRGGRSVLGIVATVSVIALFVGLSPALNGASAQAEDAAGSDPVGSAADVVSLADLAEKVPAPDGLSRVGVGILQLGGDEAPESLSVAEAKSMVPIGRR